MAQKDQPDEGPTLELPSLFRRKKRAPRGETEPSAADEGLAEPVETAPVQTDVLDEPVGDFAEEPVEEPAPPLTEATDTHAEVVVEPESEREIEEPPVDLAPAPEPEPEPVDPEPVPEPIEPVDEAPPVEDEPVVVAPLETATVVAEPLAEHDVETEEWGDEAPPEPEPVPAVPKPPMRDRIEDGLPDLAAGTAAVVVGAVVGLLGCIATFLSLQGCELATGTDSCGGPGLLVLIVILVGMILVGAMLLRMFRVSEPGNLSFLGVAITAVVILLFLIKYLFSPWMFAVVPVLSALSFALAQWVTTRWTDDGDDRKTDYSHDVR